MLVDPPSPAEVERYKVKGWTRQRLATWGVPWPPPKGWKSQLREKHKRGEKIVPIEVAEPTLF